MGAKYSKGLRTVVRLEYCYLGWEIPHIAREHGICEQTVYKWRKEEEWPPPQNPLSLEQGIRFFQIGLARVLMHVFEKSIKLEYDEEFHRLSQSLRNYTQTLTALKQYTTFDFAEQMLSLISQVRQGILKAENLTEDERAKMHAIVQQQLTTFSNEVQVLFSGTS
jgi:hypothetical protein